MAKTAVARKRIDPVEDFDTPVRREPSLEAESSAAPTVAGTKVLMHFVRVKPTRTKEGDRFLNLEMSVAVTEETVRLLPDRVARAHSLMAKNHSIPYLEVQDVEPQTVAIYDASDMDKASVRFPGIEPKNVSIGLVEESGAGEARKVVRLSLTLPIPQEPESALWALQMHGELVWVELVETQGKFQS